MNRSTIALWVLGGLMLVAGFVFNNGATNLEAASLVQGQLGSNLIVGSLIVWALALHSHAGGHR
ncbi:hypothetical protein [Georgenia sp. H159]|uniref:hypothetical protein n=1 Tax=Georgenia sp. H159 TaxID=3076115 RepID=UPI002D7845A2|nr:hypothetical protein [Georgenia sp. H159]